MSREVVDTAEQLVMSRAGRVRSRLVPICLHLGTWQCRRVAAGPPQGRNVLLQGEACSFVECMFKAKGSTKLFSRGWL